ncbi:hypothetical protein Bealeia2_02054 (plasmid) [Candidatus Bealeia paramacronuclearis]|nr:hypothetical protein [Candidatus Bealeia paramacronuclearis]
MKKVAERLAVIHMSNEERNTYFAYLKEAVHSQDVLLAASEKGEKSLEKGRAEGLAEGLEKGREERGREKKDSTWPNDFCKADKQSHLSRR